MTNFNNFVSEPTYPLTPIIIQNRSGRVRQLRLKFKDYFLPNAIWDFIGSCTSLRLSFVISLNPGSLICVCDVPLWGFESLSTVGSNPGRDTCVLEQDT